MIDGHGDDLHLHGNISMNFSSNIFAHADISPIKAHLAAHLDVIAHYPEPEARSLETKIAHNCHVNPDEVVVTNGAVDAIYTIAEACRNLPLEAHHIMQPTFAEYEDACRAAQLPVSWLTEADVAKCSCNNQWQRPNPHALWLCHPNNPTGNALPIAVLETLAQSYRLMIIDQSYAHCTSMPSLDARKVVAMGNVISIHSMTKSCAIPGLRLGYVVAAAPLANLIRSRLRPWTVNALAIAAGHYILDHHFHAIPHLKSYLAEAQRLRTMLLALPHISVQPTSTNFMLCHIATHTAAQLKTHLATHEGILIRDASNFKTLTPHHFRIAAQLPHENDCLAAAIKRFLDQAKHLHHQDQR